MEEKVFIVEYYFRSYRSGCEWGPSFKEVAEQFREKFNKTAPSNTVMPSLRNVTVLVVYCFNGRGSLVDQ
jgi:hypothetical protein